MVTDIDTPLPRRQEEMIFSENVGYMGASFKIHEKLKSIDQIGDNNGNNINTRKM